MSRNALILFANNAGGAALAFAIAVLIGRTLGAEGLGQYKFVIAWITPLALLADFGLGTLLTRDAARDRSAAIGLLRSANRALPWIVGAVLIAASGALLLTLLTAQVAPSIAIGILLAGSLIALDPWYGLYSAMFRAFERMTPILVVNVGGLFVQLLLTAFALRTASGFIGSIGALVIVNVAQLALIGGWWRRFARPMPAHDSAAPTTRELIRRAVPFALATLIGALGVRLNVLLIGWRVGDSAVGLYSAASSLFEAGRLLPNALFGALFPVLSRLAAQPAELRSVFRRSAVLLTLISSGLALSLAISAPLLLHLTYRDAFVSAAPLVQLLSVALVPSVLHGLLNVYLYSLGRENLVNRVSLIALIAQALIGGLCVAAFGAIGAALASVIVECAALVLLSLHRTHLIA